MAHDPQGFLKHPRVDTPKRPSKTNQPSNGRAAAPITTTIGTPTAIWSTATATTPAAPIGPLPGCSRTEQCGLLDETIVVWGGEFGRQPTAENPTGTGRDHNAYGFTMWLAGGGIKGASRPARPMRWAAARAGTMSSTCTPWC